METTALDASDGRAAASPSSVVSEEPLTDASRLDALARYEVMDTDPEAGFDGLARLAAEICGTPVGLITFVDDQRQFFKASVGFAGDRISPMDVGFCPQVVQAGASVTIPDTQADARHIDNSATKNGVRFYAGVPLVTSDAQVLGRCAFWILSRVPTL